MQALIHVQVLRCDFKGDLSGDLLNISQCGALKHEVHLLSINVINILIVI
jgi:hypothetical protein